MEDSTEDESAIFITQSQRSENAAAVGVNGLSEKVLDENQNEDYNQSVVISTHSTKIVISYK